ncbi:hypothetical protein M422DRAFT_250398 [Sphaerobolus stellatus SS14]|uniref:F-box domain-containing protein n=1 Tax=Sphaerobolus stellatus (strain SS14) TaxID=990650 RepID=A0A0C9W409_SPHS4|nr:hypothetical protein M422DRAFT_250398 [Sphaerobolus stellatus SS14]
MEHLPNELPNNIAAEINRPKDLLALAMTSKAWYYCIIPDHLETRILFLAYHVHTLELGNGSTGTARVPVALLAAHGINYDSTILHQALSNNLKKAMP